MQRLACPKILGKVGCIVEYAAASEQKEGPSAQRPGPILGFETFAREKHTHKTPAQSRHTLGRVVRCSNAAGFSADAGCLNADHESSNLCIVLAVLCK